MADSQAVAVVDSRVKIQPSDFSKERDEVVGKIEDFKARVTKYQSNIAGALGDQQTHYDAGLAALKTEADSAPKASPDQAKIEATIKKLDALTEIVDKKYHNGFFGGTIMPAALTNQFKEAAAEFAALTGTRPISLDSRTARIETTKAVQDALGLKGDNQDGKPGLTTLGKMVELLQNKHEQLVTESYKQKLSGLETQLSAFGDTLHRDTGVAMTEAKKPLETDADTTAKLNINQLQTKTNTEKDEIQKAYQRTIDAADKTRKTENLQAVLNKSYHTDLSHVESGQASKDEVKQLTNVLAAIRARTHNLDSHSTDFYKDLKTAKKVIESDASLGSAPGERAKKLQALAETELEAMLPKASGQQSFHSRKFNQVGDGTVDAAGNERMFTRLAQDVKSAEIIGDNVKVSFWEKLRLGRDPQEHAEKTAKVKAAKVEHPHTPKAEKQQEEKVVDHTPRPEVTKFGGVEFSAADHGQKEQAHKLLGAISGHIGAQIFKTENDFRYTVEKDGENAVFKFYANVWNKKDQRLVDTVTIPTDLSKNDGMQKLQAMVTGLEKDGEIRKHLFSVQDSLKAERHAPKPGPETTPVKVQKTPAQGPAPVETALTLGDTKLKADAKSAKYVNAQLDALHAAGVSYKTTSTAGGLKIQATFEGADKKTHSLPDTDLAVKDGVLSGDAHSLEKAFSAKTILAAKKIEEGKITAAARPAPAPAPEVVRAAPSGGIVGTKVEKAAPAPRSVDPTEMTVGGLTLRKDEQRASALANYKKLDDIHCKIKLGSNSIEILDPQGDEKLAQGAVNLKDLDAKDDKKRGAAYRQLNEVLAKAAAKL